jgi:hypothetical protein
MEKSEAELQLALDRIAVLNRELGRDPAGDPLYFRLTDPVQLAAAKLTMTVKKSIRAAEAYPRDAKASAELYAQLATRELPDEKARAASTQVAARHAKEYEEKQVKATAHLTALHRKLSILQTDPERMFLPLGAHVRITGDGRYQSTVDDIRSGVFAVGTEGVVVRLNSDAEYGVAVAVVAPFVTERGDRLNASETRPHVVSFDPEQLEIIAFGRLPDGSASQSFGFTATHISDDGDEEMVIESNGRFWQFEEDASERGRLEASGAYESLDDIDDTLRPLSDEPGVKM